MINCTNIGRSFTFIFEGDDLDRINEALRIRVLRKKGRLGRTSRQRRIWRKIAFEELMIEAVTEKVKEL